MKKLILLISIALLLTSCGFVQETNFLPNNFQDPDAPIILSVTPAEGSKIDGSTISQIDIVFSEDVLGADVLGNYSFSGAGSAGLSIDAVSFLGMNGYRLDVSGVPGDGQIVLNIDDVADAIGNALEDNTVSYTGWWDTSWLARRSMTFDNSAQSEGLTDFPVLVLLNNSRIDYGLTQDTGQDVRFVDAGGNILPHEIERWDESGESVVWVKVPQIDGGSTTDSIWLYYGNDLASENQDPQNVWDSDYIGVWHLSDTGATFIDSTFPDNNGAGEGTVTADSNGAVAGAQELDAGSDRIIINADLGATITISTWAKLDSLDDMLWCIDNDNRGPDLWFNNNGNIYLNTWDGTSNLFCAQPVNVNQWHHYVAVISAAQTVLYIDGLWCGSAAYRDPTETIIYIGSSSTGYTWDGGVDEFRISNAVRSADWIAAQYLSMSDSLISFGTEE